MSNVSGSYQVCPCLSGYEKRYVEEVALANLPTPLAEPCFDPEDTPGSIHDIPLYSSMPFSGEDILRPLEDANILRSYGPAAKRLLLFDYDGTLADIVSNPTQALLGAGVHEAISELANNPKNRVYIISGRDRKFLQGEFCHTTHLGLVAEHGAFIRVPTSTEWQNRCQKYDMTWKDSVESKMRDFERSVPGSSVDEKTAALVCKHSKRKSSLTRIVIPTGRPDILIESLSNSNVFTGLALS